MRGTLHWIVVVFLLATAAACNSAPTKEVDADAGDPDEDVVTADSDLLDGDDDAAVDYSDPDGEPDALDASEDLSVEDIVDAPEEGDVEEDAAAPAEFLVLTINLKHPLTGLAEAHERLQIVANAILDRQPDLVALQEVINPDDEPCFAEQLATMTGYEWFWEHTYRVPLYFDEGIGILSRWPVIWHDSRELPHLDLVIFRRRVLGTSLASPHGEIQLFCSHMTTDSDETVEADQALAVYEFIAGRPSPLPSFFAGDLNAEPDTLAMRFFRGEADHEGVTGNFTDAWMTVNPGDPGYTMSSSDPTRRIDYIYVVPGTEQSAEVVSCELMFTEPIGGRYASDHLGVLCLFSVE